VAIAAIALAVPVAVPKLTSGRSPATGLVISSSPHPAPSRSPSSRAAGAVPGTASEGCADQISGLYGKNWQSHSIHVGPLWLIDVRPAGASRDGTSPLPFGNLPVNVADNAHVQVKVAGPARAYFRFLFGGAGTGGRYTLRDGQTSVTFTGCRRGREWGAYPGYTQFWGGFVTARVPACVPLDVWTHARQQPARITMAVGSIRCAHGA